MPAGLWNIVAEQGATFDEVLTFRDPAGAPIDLTGATARMQVRDGYEATSVTLELTTSNGRITLGGTAGTIALFVLDTDMSAIVIGSSSVQPPQKDFVYDLEIRFQTGTVIRLLQGLFSVTRNVTR